MEIMVPYLAAIHPSVGLTHGMDVTKTYRLQEVQITFTRDVAQNLAVQSLNHDSMRVVLIGWLLHKSERLPCRHVKVTVAAIQPELCRQLVWMNTNQLVRGFLSLW